MNRRTFLSVVALLGTAACSSAPRPPLANAQTSPDALARAVLDSLAAGDRTRLEALALNEQEFAHHVWPHLPAARPERNLPLSYVWGDLHQKSLVQLADSMKRYAGRTYTLDRVTFSGETRYPQAVVHRAARLHVRNASGEDDVLRVCGSMIDVGGSWKVFSYVVD